MSFYKASKKKEDLAQGGGNYIVKSGIYPVTILAPVVQVNDKGGQVVDMYVEHNGQKQIIYGNLRLTNNDGQRNEIGSKIFNQLVIIADVEDVSEPVEHDLPIGKKEAMKKSAVLEDLCDIDTLMRVQMEYSVYKGSIQERKVIKAFFRADGASAEEIVQETEIGKQIEREQKYADNVTYKDGLTEADIAAWIAASRPEGTAPSGGGTGGGSEPEKAPSFGKKRSFGGKKD